MILKVFTVRDAKVEAYMQPFFARAKGEALRSFMDTVSKPDHQFSEHPEDFSLYYLGEYDENTGALLPLTEPELMGKAIDLKGSI